MQIVLLLFAEVLPHSSSLHLCIVRDGQKESCFNVIFSHVNSVLNNNIFVTLEHDSTLNPLRNWSSLIIAAATNNVKCITFTIAV